MGQRQCGMRGLDVDVWQVLHQVLRGLHDVRSRCHQWLLQALVGAAPVPIATTAQLLSGTSLAVRRARPRATLARPRLTGSLQFHAAESWSASRLSEAKYATGRPLAHPPARRAMIPSMESLL